MTPARSWRPRLPRSFCAKTPTPAWFTGWTRVSVECATRGACVALLLIARPTPGTCGRHPLPGDQAGAAAARRSPPAGAAAAPAPSRAGTRSARTCVGGRGGRAARRGRRGALARPRAGALPGQRAAALGQPRLDQAQRGRGPRGSVLHPLWPLPPHARCCGSQRSWWCSTRWRRTRCTTRRGAPRAQARRSLALTAAPRLAPGAHQRGQQGRRRVLWDGGVAAGARRNAHGRGGRQARWVQTWRRLPHALTTARRSPAPAQRCWCATRRCSRSCSTGSTARPPGAASSRTAPCSSALRVGERGDAGFAARRRQRGARALPCRCPGRRVTTAPHTLAARPRARSVECPQLGASHMLARTPHTSVRWSRLPLRGVGAPPEERCVRAHFVIDAGDGGLRWAASPAPAGAGASTAVG